MTTPTDPPSRVDEIRSKVMVLSPSFHAAYLDWFVRLGAQDITDDDVSDMLGASVAELDRLEMLARTGRISPASLAVARQQVRDLAEGLLLQNGVDPATKDQIRHYIVDTFPFRLLDVPGRRYSHDWFTYHEATWRQHVGHLATTPGLRFLEIGAFEGRSTCWMLEELLTAPGSHIVCVDPFIAYPEQEHNFDHNIAATGSAAKVIKLRCRSQQVLHFLDPLAYDLVYVDGSHSGLDVVQDAALAWPLVKPGGWLIFDDYEDAVFPGSFGFPCKPAIDAFLSMVAGRYDLMFKDWQVGVRKRA